MTFEIAGSSALRTVPENRVSVDVNNLTVSVKSKDSEKGNVPILNKVSLDLPKCNMMAIMGGSGAGKTTLLNVLAQRINIHHTTLRFEGSMKYITESKNKITTAYMQQEDVFLPGLTLRETLSYQAELRLPNSNKDERNELVNSLLQLLELNHRAEEIIKSFTNHINLSGGEQRRTSLAIQLLNKPDLLFLDEPTTGLDTTSALTLVNVLRRLASPEIGITVIISIHQPRPEIASLFDKLCVLTRGGRLIYCDALSGAPDYFARLHKKGIVPNMDINGDSFKAFNAIMNMSVKSTRSVAEEAKTSRIVDSLVQEWHDLHTVESALSRQEEKDSFKQNLKDFSTSQPLPIWRELYVLTRRTFVVSYRDRASLLALNGGSLFLAIVLGWIFYKPTPDLSGIRSITSAMYVMLETMGFAPLLMEIERLWAHDGVFFFKEYKENCVSIPGFIISRRVAKMMLEDVPMGFIFATVTYFMYALRYTDDNFTDQPSGNFFGVYLAVTFLMGLVAFCSGMMCFALASDFSYSALLGSAFYQLQNSGCGYFVNAKTMPVYVRWVKYTAHFWYGFGAVTSNQYTDWKGKCPYPWDDSRCDEYTGNYQLDTLGFPRNWINLPIGVLVAFWVGYLLIVWAGLRFRNYDLNVAKKKKNKIGGNDDENEDLGMMSSESLEDEKDSHKTDEVNINVKNITLSVKVRESKNPFKHRSDRVLLDNVTANFKANAVNVIMGPSGGGKTTFLNLLADRLSKTSSFKRNGEIFINETTPVTPGELSKIAAYVTQQDNLLIPQLTVRETLYYQAKLRLPLEEHPRIPSLINYLMRQTGLIDCADTPVGSQTVKGISGGEKRRVSIAIQLLGRPKVLFLDEPTSGLDTSTSETILKLLRELAENGTTIIMTIHQPSKEMFWQFDSMVLLARGGFVIYNGEIRFMPHYFEGLGHPCPQNVNFADFVLDVVSLQMSETKEQSQARVNYLIQSWKTNDVAKGDFSGSMEMDLSKYEPVKVPLMLAFKTVYARTFKVSYRAKDLVIARVGQPLVLAAVYALFFAPLKQTTQGISDRLGLTQCVINLYFCGLLNNLAVYPTQRDLFHQEYKDGAYGSSVFSITYFLVELPFELIPCIIFSVLVVFGVGLPRNASMFFAMLLTSTFCINAGESLGIMTVSLVEHLGLATNILSNLVIIGVFMAGTMSLQMPPFFKAWNYINPAKYAVNICMNLAFPGQKFSCNGGNCALDTGDAVLKYYGLEATLRYSIGEFIGCVAAYRLVSSILAWGRAKWFV